MALKLTRRLGETIVIKHTSLLKSLSEIRFTVRKIGEDGTGKYIELQYVGNLDFAIESSDNSRLSCKSSQFYTIKHYLNGSNIIMSAFKYKRFLFDCEFGFDHTHGSQIRIWFEATREVKISRDELENHIYCLN